MCRSKKCCVCLIVFTIYKTIYMLTQKRVSLFKALCGSKKKREREKRKFEDPQRSRVLARKKILEKRERQKGGRPSLFLRFSFFALFSSLLYYREIFSLLCARLRRIHTQTFTQQINNSVSWKRAFGGYVIVLKRREREREVDWYIRIIFHTVCVSSAGKIENKR